MGNKLYKFAIDAPATVNKTKSYLLPLNKNDGEGFRIEKMWIQSPDLDAIAATDRIIVQFSTLARNEETTVFEIISEYEIFTHVFDFHLAEAAIESLVDPTVCMEVPDVVGTIFDCGKKNYITHLQTGQDGAIDLNVKILGQYIGKGEIEDWNYNVF